ncbi:NirD/YgiW/YdeI family stress tolerance protein [Pantoea sp. KPR_PJ]|uniref:NirD/YgiW/YdeI family stress tolerance protein n=1 Tax=Pantoea sp. KPR_PJ TaxID=2738375 RepID=UPI003526C7D9
MKKILFIVLTLTGSFSAFAREDVTVAQAKTMHDDRHVTLTGTITGCADDDHYWFQDATGRIRIKTDDEDDSDDRYLAGKKVRISGEIDHDGGRTEIDVHYLTVLK